LDRTASPSVVPVLVLTSSQAEGSCSRVVSKNNDEQVNLVEIALPSSAYHRKGVGDSVIKPGTVRRLSKLRISVVRYLIKKRDALCSTLIVLPINFVEVDRI
jgi:hypothetical protein